MSAAIDNLGVLPDDRNKLSPIILNSQNSLPIRPKQTLTGTSIKESVNIALNKGKNVVLESNGSKGIVPRNDSAIPTRSEPSNGRPTVSGGELSDPIPSEPKKSESSEPLPSVGSPIKKRVIRTVKKTIKKSKVPEPPKKPNYGKMPAKEIELHRLNFKNKFALLRKWYPSMPIPEGIEDHPDLDHVHDVYEKCVTFMYGIINSSFYKAALLLSWLGLEFLGTTILGLDVSGYAQQQMDLLWVYEPLIDELSQVDFSGIAAGWSPLQKIIGISLASFAFMIGIKIILSKMSDKMGMNLGGLPDTAVKFIATMFSPQVGVDKINLLNQTQVSNSVQGVPSMAIPQPPRDFNNQVGMVNTAIKMYNLSGAKQQELRIPGQTKAPAPVVQPSPTQPSPVVQPAGGRVLRRPTFES